jgi:hypothetical protein
MASALVPENLALVLESLIVLKRVTEVGLVVVGLEVVVVERLTSKKGTIKVVVELEVVLGEGLVVEVVLGEGLVVEVVQGEVAEGG